MVFSGVNTSSEDITGALGNGQMMVNYDSNGKWMVTEWFPSDDEKHGWIVAEWWLNGDLMLLSYTLPRLKYTSVRWYGWLNGDSMNI